MVVWRNVYHLQTSSELMSAVARGLQGCNMLWQQGAHSHLHYLARQTHGVAENTEAAALWHLVRGKHDSDHVVRVLLTKRLRIALDEFGIVAAKASLNQGSQSSLQGKDGKT